MTRPPRESLKEWYDKWGDDYYWERDDDRVHELMEAFTLAIEALRRYQKEDHESGCLKGYADECLAAIDLTAENGEG